MSDPNLFDTTFLNKLERLALVSRRRRAGRGKGERRSTRKGSSIEFVDYRHYTPGDDPRQVDWNAYGRSGNLFVKLFEDEEVLTTHLLLDVSASMDWGEPNKLHFARRLAAALGYVVLSGMERLIATPISDGRIQTQAGSFGPAWGRRDIAPLFVFLAACQASGVTDLGAAIGRYLDQQRHSGLAILISDLLSPTAEAAIKRLIARHYEVVVLHVLAPQETLPVTGEGVRLVDRETGHTVELFLDQHAVDLYQERFLGWSSGLRHFCSQHDVVYERLDSSSPLEQVLFDLLQRRGVLR